MSHMYNEIKEQVSVIKHISNIIQPELEMLEKYINKKRPKHIVMVARGSSDNACQYFKYLCEIHAGITVSFAAPSTVSLYHAWIDYSDSMIIAVSQSGQAQDVIEIMKLAKDQHAFVLALTNDTNSPIAKLADLHIDIHAGKEYSVAATKSFTAQLYCLLEIANILSTHKLNKYTQSIAAHVENVLKQESKIFEVANQYIYVKESYILARGYLYSIALESSLKIQETSYINSKGYALSDFHHGPFAAIDQDSHIIIFLKSGITYQNGLEMIEKVRKTNCHLIVFSDQELIDFPQENLIILPTVDDTISPFLYITAMQLFAWKVSTLRGLNPDEPRGLKKVTITK